MDHYFSVIRSTKETFAIKPDVLTYGPTFSKKNLDMFRVRGTLKTEAGMGTKWDVATACGTGPGVSPSLHSPAREGGHARPPEGESCSRQRGGLGHRACMWGSWQHTQRPGRTPRAWRACRALVPGMRGIARQVLARIYGFEGLYLHLHTWKQELCLL